MSVDNNTTDESSTDDEQAIFEENNSSAPHTAHHEHSYSSPALRRESLDLRHIPYEIPEEVQER